MTLQAGQLGLVPSQVQHISVHCGICVGFLVCLVVYSVGTSCKIPATARGFSLIHNFKIALLQHSLLFSDLWGLFLSRKGGVKHPGCGA